MTKVKVTPDGFASKREELAHLEANGKLKPGDVVAYATNPKTHLHKCFEWDDSAAAAKYRLDQARTQIRMYVMVVEGPKAPIEMRQYVSLPSDRKRGGGYRKVADVLKNKALLAELIDSAMKDLAVVRARYEAVQALKPVWAAAERVATKSGVAKLRKAA